RSSLPTYRPFLELLEDRALLAVALTGVPAWLAEGPGPILGGQTEGLNFDLAHAPAIFTNPVSGAINAIAADPIIPDRVFVGTVGGGIWRTTTATAGSPTWTPLTDAFPSLSIRDLRIS